MEENSHLPIKSLVEFMDELDKKKASLPYNINVIDELHINENAHSRILHKLLEFRAPNGKYELLQSLIDYIKTAKKKFADLEITNPTITHEEARIDLWVRDENNAIIFENKVYNAVDQEAQLSRYIEKTNETYHDRSKIFVVYLPDVGDKDPDPQTWGPYKDEFESRYVKLSFRDDIRTWLRDYVLPNIRLKDTLLKSAVVQYLDFLDGLFSQRLNDKAMNEKKMQSLDKILGMNDEISMHGVKNIKEKVDSLITILENYKNRLAHAVRNELEKRIKNQLLSPEFDSL
ncbi:MAG: PD-(D/E)XK nuclease family protein, partial [Muribaculaceae bacterium]|nr:PD-(D/E)XK nuclease family protein [Muribaculaceae bacterium]